MKIHLATDHAGFALKEATKTWLNDLDYDEVVDHGAHELVETDDYPDFIKLAAEAVSENPDERAIIFGASGQGEDMVADKFEHVRSAVYYGGPLEIVKLSREHNDANILSIGARFVTGEQAREAIELWLKTPFSGAERHQRRVDKIDDL
jgi:ribose 5-phosphate isomerase B